MHKMHNTPGVAGPSAEHSSRMYAKKRRMSQDHRVQKTPMDGKFIKHNKPRGKGRMGK